MPNNLLTPSLIAKEAMLQLNSTTVFGNLVHRNYDQDFTAKQGDTVTIRKPATFTADEFNAGTGINVQNVTESSTSVTLDTIADVSFEIGAKELTLSLEKLSEQVIAPAMQAIAQKIDTKLANLALDINNYAEVSGTPAIGDLGKLNKVLNINKVPQMDRRLVFGAYGNSNFITLAEFINAEKSGTTEALRNANMGRVFGFDTYLDQNVYQHTKGTLGTSKVKTGITAGASSGTFYNTSLTGTLKKGDIFTLAGDTTSYVVTKDASASANEIAVEFYPPLAITAAGDVAVTIVDTTKELNVAFHKNAFALVSRPLELPMGNPNAYVVNYNGFSLRVITSYDIKYKKDIFSVDTLFGVKTLDPRLACRLHAAVA